MAASYYLPVLRMASEQAGFRTNPVVFRGNQSNDDPDLFRMVTVMSSPESGVLIAVSKADQNGDQDGNTPMTRTFAYGETVMFSTPAEHNGSMFQFWLRNGIPFSTNPSIEISVLSDLVLHAIYIPPLPTHVNVVIRSHNPESGVPIMITTPDIDGQQDGTTTMLRVFENGTTVTFIAPATHGSSRVFKQWILDGVPLTTNASVQFVFLQDREIIAEYRTDPQPQGWLMLVR